MERVYPIVYGTGPIRAELADRQVDVLAPVPEGHAKHGRLAKRDFHIDLHAATVTCPAGHSAAIRTERSGQRRAEFAKALCGACRCAIVASHPRAAPDRSSSRPTKNY